MRLRTMQKRNITPLQAVKILGKNGIVATEAEAVKILDFMYFLAGSAIGQYFSEDEKSPELIKI